MHEYLLSYADEYWEENDGVHWFIDFTNGTTTSANDLGIYYYVAVYEYVDGEQHDASDLGTGLILGEYHVYKDNGDIVDIEAVIAEEES